MGSSQVPRESSEASRAMLVPALELAERGWRVFPCQPQGPKAKSPYLQHGHLDATDVPETITSYWTRWPDAMIGAPVPDALLVLDIDPRNGGSLAALEALVGPLPPTLTAWSGRDDGGKHLYFLRPDGPLTSTKLPVGIDLKVNGYVILPPSLHPVSGKPYWWEVRDPVPLPSRLLALLRPAPVARYRRPIIGSSASGAPLVRLVQSLTDGKRNRGLYWAACRARDDGILHLISEDLISAAVAVGLPEVEARRTLASAAQAVRRSA